MAVSVHQTGCNQAAGHFQHLGGVGAGVLDFVNASYMGNVLVLYFNCFGPGLGRIAGINPSRKNRNIHTFFLSMYREKIMRQNRRRPRDPNPDQPEVGSNCRNGIKTLNVKIPDN